MGWVVLCVGEETCCEYCMLLCVVGVVDLVL